MRTIHKFPLTKVGKDQSIEMPVDSYILKIDRMPVHGKDDLFCESQVCIWALVDTEQPMEKREIFCVGTGEVVEEFDLIIKIVSHPPFGLSSRICYIGSIIFEEKCEIWHYFEKMAPPTRR